MKRATIRIEDAAAGPWSAASFCMEQQGPTVLFETQAGRGDQVGQSMLCVFPTMWLCEKDGEFVEQPSGRRVDDPLLWIRSHHRAVEVDSGSRWTGGLAGYLGFEFGWRLDCFDTAPTAVSTPNLWVGVFPAGATYDHGHGFWTVTGRSAEAAKAVAEVIRRAPATPIVGRRQGRRDRRGDVDGADYRVGVQSAIDAIYDGAFFEVNYTERFGGGWNGDRRGLYDGLRRRAPGGYGGIVDVDELFLASVSPEQFLSVQPDGKVTTRPIKGTRPRGKTPDADRRLAAELQNSEKDRAENVMIVDLMRNDLTKVCMPGSVEATELCALHSFDSVHHLVSTVKGQLAPSFDALDVFASSFPAGSITGAPKLRVMQWISAHEQSGRGPYTGSMFYWSDHGRFDSNVLIRTAVLEGQQVEYGTGGAVVADSDPAGEYDEALWKAQPFFDLLEQS